MRGSVSWADAVLIAATYAAGHIDRDEAERLMFTDEELRMTPEERRRGNRPPADHGADDRSPEGASAPEARADPPLPAPIKSSEGEKT